MQNEEEEPHQTEGIEERWFKKYRIVLTFLPAIAVGVFNPLLGFCFFIMLLEKSVLSMLGLPGLEFTTTATFLFGLKYDLTTAVLLAFFLPNFIIKPIKFVLWREYVNPEEGPVNLSVTAVFDVMVATIAYILKNLNIIIGLSIALIVKHSLNILRTRNSDRPEMFDAAISFASNIGLVVVFYKLIMWLLS